jgi:hypothetical protein
MDELTEALAIASKVLDEPYCDPDDDLRIVARQLGRLYERFNQTVGESNRYRTALLELYPGLVLDRRYADADDDIDALNSRVETIGAALYPDASQASES